MAHSVHIAMYHTEDAENKSIHIMITEHVVG